MGDDNVRGSGNPVIRLAANVSFHSTELPFLARFEAAAQAGFRAVEFAFAYDVAPRELALRLRNNGLELALLIPRPVMKWPASLAWRWSRAASGIRRRYSPGARILRSARRDSDSFSGGQAPGNVDKSATEELFLNNLCRAADLDARANRIVTLEPLNRRDRPGYYFSSNTQVRLLIAASGRQNVRLQLGLYHSQISEGDLIGSIEREIALIGHVQIAGVPERAEPISERWRMATC